MLGVALLVHVVHIRGGGREAGSGPPGVARMVGEFGAMSAFCFVASEATGGERVHWIHAISCKDGTGWSGRVLELESRLT